MVLDRILISSEQTHRFYPEFSELINVVVDKVPPLNILL